MGSRRSSKNNGFVLNLNLTFDIIYTSYTMYTSALAMTKTDLIELGRAGNKTQPQTQKKVWVPILLSNRLIVNILYCITYFVTLYNVMFGFCAMVVVLYRGANF